MAKPFKHIPYRGGSSTGFNREYNTVIYGKDGKPIYSNVKRKNIYDDYYDGYHEEYPSYRNGYSSKYGKYSYGGSSWGFWNSWGAIEEDNSHLIVREPENYTTPTTVDIRAKTTTAWQVSHMDQIKELARICYFKMISDKNYFVEKYQDFDNLPDELKAEVANKKEFYDAIFDNFIPGFTPLEQAINIFNRMSNQANGEVDKSKLDMSMDENTLVFDRELYSDPNINDQLELNKLSQKYKIDILNHLSVIGDLGQQFKVEKEVEEKIVSNSDTLVPKMMRDYAQIANIQLYQKMFPNFAAKLMTKDLVVTIPVDRKEKKQKIIIILDYSGSMDDTAKQIWVNALLIDRFKYVMKEEAEVFFSYFVSSTKTMEFTHLKDRNDVLNFWAKFSNHPDGGTTRVGSMVQYINTEIHTYHKLHNLNIDLSKENPEILVINDGQDHIDSDSFPHKVNAVCVEDHNQQLQDLCLETEGKYVHVDIYGMWNKKNTITTYSKEGKQILTS